MVEARVYNLEFLYLTTTGWKSKQAHEIEIWYVAHGNCYYLVSERAEAAHWVKNIQHNPKVTFWVQGQIYTGIGRTIDGTTDAEWAGAIAGLMQAKYNWSDGLIVELCPE